MMSMRYLWVGVVALGLLAPAALADSASTCTQQTHQFYNQEATSEANTIQQGEPALGEISSCISSLISMFDLNMEIYVPDYEEMINELLGEVCSATKGEITGIVGNQPPGGGIPPPQPPPGGGHPPPIPPFPHPHPPPGGPPGIQPKVSAPPASTSNVWNQLLGRYGAPAPETGP